MAILSADNLFRSLLPAVPLFKNSDTAEAAGTLHSALYIAGAPGAGVAPSPGLAGAALTSYAGQIPFPAAVGGKSVYLAAVDMIQSTGVGCVYVVDRLWHNSAVVVTTTGSQAINSVAFPARDLDGTVNGRGVGIAIEVSTDTTNVGAVTNTTMSYTNSLGTSGRTATIESFPATAVDGTFVPFALQAGDVGVQSIQSVTLGTSYGGGAIHLVAYRQIAAVPLAGNNFATSRNALDIALPKLFDSSVPWFVYMPNSTSVGRVTGSLAFAQG